jgi:hypothetical protein
MHKEKIKRDTDGVIERQVMWSNIQNLKSAETKQLIGCKIPHSDA